MYFLSGKGMYRADNDWVPVKAGDYMFLDAYCPQACYAVGREEDFAYIYPRIATETCSYRILRRSGVQI